jgi:hypothetical protein
MRGSVRHSIAAAFFLIPLGVGGSAGWIGCGTGELELQGQDDPSRPGDVDAPDAPDRAAPDLAGDPPAGDASAESDAGDTSTAGEDAADAAASDPTADNEGRHDDPEEVGPCELAVSVTEPVEGASVTGLVSVRASAACATHLELWVDGQLTGSDAAAPYDWVWDTAAAHENALPSPNHAIDYAYYFVDYKGVDNRHEVNHYTNQYYAWAWRAYVSDADWPPLLRQSIENAVADGHVIHLNVEDETYWADALDVAAPYWAQVRRVEVADEPGWDQAETEAVLTRFRAELGSRGLAERPLGIVYTRNQILTGDGLFAAGLDWVGIEAYVDVPDSSPVSAENVALLNDYLGQAKARVPADKDIVIVMMAYDRNGAWTNLDTLVDLQAPAYLVAYDDPRVVAINMFSYTRPGGSHDHPELRVPHKRIAERILDIVVPELSNGPHLLEVHAFDAAGGSVSASRTVTVAN